MRRLLQKMGYRPRNGVWEITLRCNLRCIHCGSSAGSARGEELSTDEAFAMADQLAEIGLPNMTVSGGEPLLRKDWHLIAKRLIDNGVTTNLITNGLLVNERVIEQAREAGLKNLVFSFDGVKDVHDLIRNVDGAYDKLLNAFDTCRREGYPFSVVSMVHGRNVGSLPEIYRVLRDRGAFAWQIQIGTPMGNFAKYPELYVQPEGLLSVIRSMASVIDLARSEGKVRMYVADCTGYYGPLETTLRKESELGFWFGCVAGCQIIGVEANGGIKGCLTMQSPDFTVGNFRDRPLREIWGDDNNFSYNRCFETDQLTGFCGTCRYGEICRGGCKWNAHLSTGTLFDNKYCYHRRVLEEAGYDQDPGEDAFPDGGGSVPSAGGC